MNNNMPVAGASQTLAATGYSNCGQDPSPANKLEPLRFVRSVPTVNAGTQTIRGLLPEYQLPPNLRMHSRTLPDVPSLPVAFYPAFPLRPQVPMVTQGTQVPGEHALAVFPLATPHTVHWIPDTPENCNLLNIVRLSRL